MNDYNITVHHLPNGMPLAHIHTTSPVAWMGVAINSGSRDERPGQFGLAHFVEHTIFKGTTHRRAYNILNRMEVVGGELNAYTTREGTMIYSLFPAQYLERATELIADLVQNSTFPERELERELDVVLEEVASYRDSPSDAVYDDFEDLLFAGSEFGHNILGCEPDLRALSSQDCIDYMNQRFAPQHMALYAVSSESTERVLRLATKYFGHFERKGAPLHRMEPVTNATERRMVDLGLHQAHTVVGARTPGMHSDERFALTLLNNILAGPGMNSLLNVQLRERRGYVYTVESSLSTFTDCGMLEIYLGCEPSKLDKALALIERTTTELASTALTEKRLDAHKKQYLGQLLIATSNAEWQAMNAGRSLLYRGEVAPLSRFIERIEAVTPEQLRKAAELVAMPRCSILTLH